MFNVIYDNALFLTNEKNKFKFPNRKPTDLALTVEYPKLYIIGQSKRTDKDKLSYTEERLQNLKCNTKQRDNLYMMSCDFSVVMDQPGSLRLVSNVKATSAPFVV